MSEAKLVLLNLKSEQVGQEVPIAVLTPTGFDGSESLPLCMLLHGGGGDRSGLVDVQPLYERLWAEGSLAPMVVAAPSSGPRSWWRDRWENFVADELPQLMVQRFNTRLDPAGSFLMGVSMGGFGTLKIGLRRPGRFAALAALEPAIEPGFTRAAATPRNMFYRYPEEDAGIWGDPIDEKRWQHDNPANIARANADAIRASGIEIYLDAGDEDGLNLHDGTEFLHRALWDHDIQHEYHLVRWGNHVGPSLQDRLAEALRFLTHTLTGELVTPKKVEFTAEEQAWLEWMHGGPNPDVAPPTLTVDIRSDRGPALMEAAMSNEKKAARAADPDMARAYGRMPS